MRRRRLRSARTPFLFAPLLSQRADAVQVEGAAFAAAARPATRPAEYDQGVPEQAIGKGQGTALLPASWTHAFVWLVFSHRCPRNSRIDTFLQVAPYM